MAHPMLERAWPLVLDNPADRVARQQLRVQGVVQGVGFRPFVFRLATHLALVGFVGNDSAGVLIELEGQPAA